ncbi:chemotaxis protein CheB [Scytonema sp. PRP1]
MFKRDIIVIGASAGGLTAFETLVSQLPSNIPAAIFIVWHISPDYPSILPEILARASLLPVAHAIEREPIKPGHIYVAPPDHHLLVEPGYVRLSRGVQGKPLSSGDRCLVSLCRSVLWSASHWGGFERQSRRWSGWALCNQAARRNSRCSRPV